MNRGVKHDNIIEHKKLIPEINGIVMELAEVNLGDYLSILTEQLCIFLIRKYITVVATRLRLKWSIQISEAIGFLHSRGIIHRDIRCVNILVSN